MLVKSLCGDPTAYLVRGSVLAQYAEENAKEIFVEMKKYTGEYTVALAGNPTVWKKHAVQRAYPGFGSIPATGPAKTVESE